MRSKDVAPAGDQAPPRIGTGNPQADAILNGGFPAHSINIIMGQPGTGKTIFAEQLLFHNANGRPVLYVTTVSEPFQKVVSYLQRFSFFDADKFGVNVVYDDVAHDLIKDGPDALLSRIRSAIRELQPSIIVVDSFKAVHDLAEAGARARRWITNLAGELTATDVTTFLVGEYSTEQVLRYPEFAVADGIVEFARKPLSNRDERFFRVLKLRGSRYHEGLHGLRIGRNGIEVFPRLIGGAPVLQQLPDERVDSGIELLDRQLHGGLWRGSSSLVTGVAGTGKTTLAMQFIVEGVRRGERGIFLNFQEGPLQIARLIRSMGHDIDDLKAHGLHLRYVSPVELQIDSIIADLFGTIRTDGIKRLAIDAIGDLISAASDSIRVHDYLYSLMQQLTGFGVTSMLTLESFDDSVTNDNSNTVPISYISDNIIQLRLDASVAAPVRTLQILKARGSSHDLRTQPFVIDRSGLQASGS